MSPLTERLRALADTPLFAGLGATELRALAERGLERRFQPGEVLFTEGDACPGLHVLVGGSVKICKTSPGGREVMLAIESAPSSVAEVPLFDGGPYPATVVAIDEVTALVIRCPDFRAVCLEHPEIPIRILSVVGRRLRVIVALVDSLTFGGVRQRLARTLLDLREEAGDDTFRLPISLQELAHRLGTAREVVSRNMSRFQAHGLLRFHKGQVVILDRHGLLHEADTEM
jgi:CRP-like cAMP-binding protein